MENKAIRHLALWLTIAALLSVLPQLPGQAADAPAYKRIVVLGDPHYPTRPKADGETANEIVEAKQQVVDEINGWADVDLVVVVGDIVATRGDAAEYEQAKSFVARIKKPTAVIAGNHDFIYSDAPGENGKLQRAAPDERQRKLERFRTTYGLESLFYSRRVGDYLLLLLMPDKTDSKYLCEISERQLSWLKTTLAQNPTTPTLIFFHAPLAGTLENYNKEANTASFVAQPQHELDDVLQANPQVLLWVSGHTHTPATNDSFASAVNCWRGRIWNIHNADLDRKTIWTNSLYLYPQRIDVKTYNHKTGQWLGNLQRTIERPQTATD